MQRSSNQSGSVATLCVAIIAGVMTITVAILNSRANNELAAAQHLDLHSEKAEILGLMKSVAVCPEKAYDGCSLGDRIEILDENKTVLIDRSGSKTIGKWSLKVECLNRGDKNRYHVMGARFDGKSIDPLNRKVLDWSPVVALKEFCNTTPPAENLVLTNVCYGTVSGFSPLPPEVMKRCKNCKFEYRYCVDNQIEFPKCPDKYRSKFSVSDRFGWGGIDISKTTVCQPQG